MGQHRENDLDPGGPSVGEATATSTSSIAIPPLANGEMPERCRISISGASDSFISVTNGEATVTVINGMLINAGVGGAAVIVRTWGHTHINHIDGATGSFFNVTPLNP